MFSGAIIYGTVQFVDLRWDRVRYMHFLSGQVPISGEEYTFRRELHFDSNLNTVENALVPSKSFLKLIVYERSSADPSTKLREFYS